MLSTRPRLSKEALRRSMIWVGIAAMPVLGVWLRLRAHPAHGFDEETSLAASAAREFVHGRLLYFPHFHLNLHQGSQLIDAFLAMPGFLLFGDHVLAWASVSLFYVAVFAAAGGWIAHRFAGWPAAWLLSALLAVSPFLLKDGLLAIAGGHAPVATWAILAVALALAARGDPPPDGDEVGPLRRERLALLAGLVAGVGAFYTRSAVVAWPAVLLILWPAPNGGTLMAELRAVLHSKRLRRVLIGAAIFPILSVGLTVSHEIVQTQWGREHSFGSLLRRSLNPIVSMEGCSDYQIEVGLCGDRDQESWLGRKLNKTGEVLGAKHIRHQFLQPDSLRTGRALRSDGARGAIRDGMGAVWVLAYLVALPLLVGLVFAGRLQPLTLAVALPPLGMVAGYVFTGMRVEAPPEGWWPEVSTAPWPTEVRYLIPVWALLLPSLAVGLVAAWRSTRVGRFAAGLLGGALLLTGVGMMGWDAVVDADPVEAYERFRPFRYLRNYTAHRGPPEGAHTVCGVTDVISRANHLRSGATWYDCNVACLEDEPERGAAELDYQFDKADRACPDEALTAEDRAFLAHGMGVDFGSQAMVFNFEPIALTIGRATAVGSGLKPADQRWFFLGVVDALFDYGEPMTTSARLAVFCREGPLGGFPLCPLVGLRECEWESPRPPPQPQGLCGDGRLDFSTLEPGIVTALVYGAGRSIGHRLPPIDPDTYDWAGWSPHLKEAYLDGWAEGGRFRWRQGEDPPVYTPDKVP